jgi:organic hydroperoxide reductase OsmC/OhrA
MDTATPSTEPTVHRYHARCTWNGSTGAGYEQYPRAHSAGAPPAAAVLSLSADPAFRGDPAQLNPEQLLVLAAASCQLLSFLAVAARSRVNVVSYADEAEGEMSEADKPLRVGTIRLRPRIVLAPMPGSETTEPAADEARIRRLIELAHRQCYIANSLKTEVMIEPTIEWQ